MFRMRQEQVEAFDASYVLRAKQRLAVYASKRFPTRFPEAGDAELHRFVDRVWGAAHEHDINKENDVATFLDLSVMYGEDFYQESWASATLQSDWHGPDKMRLLKALVRASGADI